jgi:hypothetical protein
VGSREGGEPSRVRPLLVRPGARYRCFGDGLCCTDLHLLGPLTRREVVRLRVMSDAIVVWNAQLEAPVLRTTEKGGCVFLVEAGCALHAELGTRAKPGGCRRFPYRLVATPAGGRVVTEHRCPCRTLGDRPPIDLVDAEASLLDEGNRLQADQRVPHRLKRTRKLRMSFHSYAALEATWIERILAGEDPLVVLEAEVLSPLPDISWIDVAHNLRARIDGSACGDALAWFGDVLLSLAEPTFKTRAPRNRPWAAAFDRAEARSPDARTADAVLADWLADALWSLDWVTVASLDAARCELGTRWVVAREITRRLQGVGLRPDRAAAEAVSIVEITGASGVWGSVVREIDRGRPG